MKQFRDTNYYVTPLGEILNTKTNKYIKQSDDKDGYKRCTLFSKNRDRMYLRVSRIVAELYCEGYRKELQVNHIDGVKTNNHFSNLEWVTCQENIEHAWRTGLKHKNYTQEQLNDINKEATNKRYSKMSDIQKEENGMAKERNPAYNKNYNSNKTSEQLEDIKNKKQKTNQINKQNHLHKGGNAISVNGVIYKSINAMSKECEYSFKYIKRRIESNDYKEWFFIPTQGGLPK